MEMRESLSLTRHASLIQVSPLLKLRLGALSRLSMISIRWEKSD